MKKAAILPSLVIAALMAVAMPASAGTDIFVRSKLKRVQVGLSTGATVYPEASMTELDCVPGTGPSMLLEYGHSRFKDLYAMIVAAKASGMEMTFRIQAGSTGCVINYVILE